MLKFSFQIFVSCVICLYSISHSLTRPPTPTITNASYANGQIIITGSMTSAEQCHVVLLTDLSASLINAYESGSSLEGAAVSYSSTTFPIVVPLGSQTVERYFVAVAASKLEDKKRVYSPWKIYADNATGLPLAISTSQTDKRENLISRARNIDAKNPNKVLIDFTFSLKTATAPSCRFELKQGSNVLLKLSNMSTITGSKTDLINAMSDTTGIGDSLIIVSTSGSNTLYRIYQLADYSLPGDIIATIVDNNGLVIDTMDRTIGTYSDDGYMDIFSTISALARMPDGTNNPFYPTSIPAANDSTKLNLLIAAMLDLSIAHNSPLPESNEQKQGIQTNYMQFMDNIAGNWTTLRTATRGIGRLRAIHERVLAQNKGEIIDPVYVVNYGTSFEPHTVTQKRKNYALIEGFSRINWNCEVPNYGTALAGTGILFRVSDNIELYRAFIKNSFPTFDTVSFLNGATARRLIVSSNDTVVSKFISKDGGVWVKGISETEEIQFYTGIVPVRLPIAGVHNALLKIDTAFTLTTETMGNGDPIGKIVDCEQSILSVYAISNQGNRTDTLENIEEPGVLLHGQKRKLVYNTKYSTGDRVEFSVLTKGEDTGKVFIESKPTSNTAILADTSVTVSTWIALATVFANGMAIQSIGSEGTTRRLGFKDVVNGNLEVWCDNLVALAMERDDDSLIEMEKRSELEIAIRTTNGVKLYTSSSKSQQITAALLNAIVEGDKWITSWDKYESVFLNQDSIYAAIESGVAGECAITAQWKNTKQEYATEKVSVLGVPKIESIEFTSKHKDANGYNILRSSKHYLLEGNINKGPEWVFGRAQNYKFTHNKFEPVDINLKIAFPKAGTYKLIGKSAFNGLNFNKQILINEIGEYDIPIRSKDTLTNLIQKYDACKIDWRILYNTGDTIYKMNSEHDIYILKGRPKSLTAFDLPNYVTDIRLDKCFELIQLGYNTSLDSIALSIHEQMQSELLYAYNLKPLVHVNYVWFLFDQTPTSPKRFGAQCNELAVLFETLLKFLGIDAAYNQILPSAQNGIIRLWNFHNQIDVAWFLNNSDSTFHHSIDEMQWDGALGSLMPVTVKSERLLFDMGTWNEGEGSVYVNGKVYPMVYNYNYIGVGSSIMTAARNALVKIDSIDCVRPNYLQMYRVLYKFNHCNVGGEEQCKHATEYYVEIPNL